jgi:hypothetical protein
MLGTAFSPSFVVFQIYCTSPPYLSHSCFRLILSRFRSSDPYWEAVNVDLSKHVVDLTQMKLDVSDSDESKSESKSSSLSTDSSTDDEEDHAIIEKYWAKLWHKPLDPQHPLWQFLVVEKFKKVGDKYRSAVLFRAHHVYGLLFFFLVHLHLLFHILVSLNFFCYRFD